MYCLVRHDQWAAWGKGRVARGVFGDMLMYDDNDVVDDSAGEGKHTPTHPPSFERVLFVFIDMASGPNNNLTTCLNPPYGIKSQSKHIHIQALICVYADSYIHQEIVFNVGIFMKRI